MIIVSQDRKRISQNLEVGVYPEYNDEFPKQKVVCYKIENDYMTLGEYKTEERAKEILGEIIATYEHMQFLQVTQSHLIEYANKPNFIYEMPKE